MVGLYTELFYAIIPILFLCLLLICYRYIFLHFWCFLFLDVTRVGHIHITCWSIWDWDQNGIKRSTFFSGADQGMKLSSEGLIHCNIKTFSQILRRLGSVLVLWPSTKSSDQEPQKGTIKWSMIILTDQDSDRKRFYRWSVSEYSGELRNGSINLHGKYAEILI